MTALQYGGNQTYAIDPGSFSKLITSDRFGRVTQVSENFSGKWNGGTILAGNTSPSYSTGYSYDPVDDLIGVTQTGLANRAFTYDWLKRLEQIVWINSDLGPLTKAGQTICSRSRAAGALISGFSEARPSYPGLVDFLGTDPRKPRLE